MKKNRILLILLTIAILVSSINLMQRVKVEGESKSIDIILDYKEIEELANQSEEDLGWWFEKFYELGVNYVSLDEESVQTIMDKDQLLEFVMAGNLLREVDWRDTYPIELVNYIDENGIEEYDAIIMTESEASFSFIQQGLANKHSSDKYSIIENEEIYVILLHGSRADALFGQNRNLVDERGRVYTQEKQLISSKLITKGLGFDPEKVALIQESGLQAVPRFFNESEWASEAFVKGVIRDIDKVNPETPVLLFSGSEVIGYPEYTFMLESYMKENDIKVGLIERAAQGGNMEQKGIETLVRNLNYNTVRVFSVLPYVQERFQYYHYEGAEEIENILYRAVTERNIRLIYFRPFKHDRIDYVTDYEEYEKMFDGFKSRIARHGMVLGESSVMTPTNVPFTHQILMGWGIVAGGIMLMSYLFAIKDKLKYTLLGIGLTFVLLIAFVTPANVDKLLALAATVVFPGLGMLYFCRQCLTYLQKTKGNRRASRTILVAIKDLIITSLISALGGMFVASMLADVEYFVGMDFFRGVKLSQMAPIAIYIFIYVCYFGYKRNISPNTKPVFSYKDIENFLFDHIKIIYVLLAGAVLAVGYVFIARTGHETSLQPSELEMIIRNLFEQNLLVRPRTKEFLIAFPALMVGVIAAMYGFKKLIFVLGLVATIGQVGIINTFSHLRAPVYLSTIRTIYGLGFGILVGIIYIGIFMLAIRAFEAWKEGR